MGAGLATKYALVAGATGLVGREIVRLLSADETIAEIRVLVRRPLSDDLKGRRVIECRTDFQDLQQHPDWFSVDAVFCALGTTIKDAGSQQAFRLVDYEYPLVIARLARAAGARHFLVVSAKGANSRSPVFYPRVKGELENELRKIGFPSLTIARPSMLLGDRKPPRPGEEIIKPFTWLFPPAWKPVLAKKVAAALIEAFQNATSGIRILSNAQMHAWPD